MDIVNIFSQLNYGLVIIAALIHYGLGWLWYSDKMFAKEWIQDNGFSGHELKNMGDHKTMLMGFVAQFVLVASLAALIGPASTLKAGVNTALFVSIGIIAATALMNHVYSLKPWRLYLINTGFSVAALVIAGAIIGMWG
ncbi:MAG: DUF1761 domain-containing protein [Patescibacteria group bacterium]|nr:MAG: DUF1761 domain-containing protein [Patescibacteria group bacterium]